MTTINITDKNNKDSSYKLDVDVPTNTTYRVICEALLMYDKSLVLGSLSDKLKQYLSTTFSVSRRELEMYFTCPQLVPSFIEAMKKHGYFVKYHTVYKITEELRALLAQCPDDQKNLFGMDEGLLFNDLLGFDAIKYLLSSKSFQKINLLNITELTKKKATKVLDFMIYEEYATRSGTTYTITNKFIQRSKQYEALFKEEK